MKSPCVEAARQTRRIKKDYTNLNLSSKYSESHIRPPVVKKRKACPSKNKHKESDQHNVWQRQLKESVLKRCLDLGEPIPEQVLAFLNKQEKTTTSFQKINMKFPSQDAYNASIMSARRAIDFQEGTVKALVGAKDNQSLFDFMAKQRRRKYSEKEEQQDLSSRLQKEQSKQMQNSQSTMIEQLKQNLQYKINPQFIKSELKKEMMIKNQLKALNNQTENEASKDNHEYELQGKIVERENIIAEVDNMEYLGAARKFYPKNLSSTTRRSRLNTAPSTPNEPHLSPVRAPVRQTSVQIQNFGPYYYPKVSEGQATQFEDIREDILCNQEDVQEPYGQNNHGLNNSYQPYGRQWNKENWERARIMIEDQCTRDENDHLGGYIQIQQQQADRQEPNYDYQNSVDMSFLSSFCYSNSQQHPQMSQAEDMLEAIDQQQPEIEQEYFCHYQQNHMEASPLRLFHRQMLDEQDNFESNNSHADFN